MHEVKEIAKVLLVQDCMDLLNAVFGVSKSDRPVFVLASAPYMCLVTNEAYEWCKKSQISLNPFLSKELLENIRARAKLFSNDTIVRFNDQRLIIENIIKIEHAYYEKLAKQCCANFLIDDVGTYLLNNRYIGNTIQYAYDFYPFSKPNRSIYESVDEIKAFSAEIGSMLQEIIVALTGKAYKIPQTMYTTQSHTYKDFNFQNKFKETNNVLMFSLVCRINFLLNFFKKMCPQDSMLYLRLIYITFYSLKSELKNMKMDCSNIFENCFDKNFRNCMAHYSLYQKIGRTEINASATGYGLIEKYFSIDYFELVRTIECKLNLVLSELEAHYKC